MTTQQRSSRTISYQHPPTGDDLLTVKEVAGILRVDDTTIRRWIARHLIDAIELPHLGSRTVHRIKRSTVDAMIDRKREADSHIEKEEET